MGKAKKEAAWAEKKANASPEQLEKMLEKEKKRAEMKKAWELMTDDEKAAKKAEKKAKMQEKCAKLADRSNNSRGGRGKKFNEMNQQEQELVFENAEDGFETLKNAML